MAGEAWSCRRWSSRMVYGSLLEVDEEDEDEVEVGDDGEGENKMAWS